MIKITESILLKNSFERNHLLPSLFHCHTGQVNIDVTLDNEFNNSFHDHYVHVDNMTFCTIGCLELTTVEQFNKFMEAIYVNDRPIEFRLIV